MSNSKFILPPASTRWDRFGWIGTRIQRRPPRRCAVPHQTYRILYDSFLKILPTSTCWGWQPFPATAPDRFSDKARPILRVSTSQKPSRCCGLWVDRFEAGGDADHSVTSYSNTLANVHYYFALALADQGDSDAKGHFASARDTWIRIGGKQTARDKHHLAWLLATCPSEDIRDIESARWNSQCRRPSWRRTTPALWTTEALTRVLSDDTEQAMALLDRVKTLRGVWLDRDYFVLAMAQQRSQRPHRCGAVDQPRRGMDARAPTIQYRHPTTA